jgi:hypothetical protein
MNNHLNLNRHRWLTWLVGIVVGDGIVALFYWVCVLFVKWEAKTINSQYLWLGLPSFFLMPLLGGIVASYLWRRLEPTMGAIATNTLWMTLLALIGAALLFSEGIICLLIVSPFFYGMVLVGAMLGRILFKVNPTRLHVSIMPLLAIALLVEPFIRTDQVSVVTDEVIIHASSSKIWPQITSFPEIPSTADFWLFKLGLPYPVATTSAGDFVKAERSCIFSHGAVFKETVSELEPFKKLTFDIYESPADPELIGHLTPHRGQFVLNDNGDGTTTLIGSTWYTLHVRPLWYFDWWTHHIFRAVHLRVMEDIRRRAESSS